MKRHTTLFIALFVSAFTINAQDFQGMAVYESKTALPDMKIESKEITPEMQKMFQDRIRKALERTFVLNFDRTASVYAEEEKLDAPGADAGGMKMFASFTGAGGKHYKNVKTKMFSTEKEIFGKEFLVQDSLKKLDWKMENETKKIGNYTCYKATATVPANQSDFRNMRLKKQDDKKGEKKEEKSTNFMDQMEMPKDQVITAWYAPEIPVNQGPESYWGLPGLILEVSDGHTMILCSKVVLNPKEKVQIKELKKGTKVTQAEYDEIVKKKMEEMQEMYRAGGGNGTQQRTIRIGG